MASRSLILVSCPQCEISFHSRRFGDRFVGGGWQGGAMSTSTTSRRDWSSRPVPTAMSAAELAGFVETSIARTDGMLFTATPAEELDEIGRLQQIKDQAYAAQLRAIVAAYNRASSKDREFAADEVGLAIGATSTTGVKLVADGLGVCELPGLLEAVEAGQLTERHVHAVIGE